MRGKKVIFRSTILTVLLLVWMCAAAVLAEGASGDNSLSSLGITTEGVTVSPEFFYSTIEYNVTVPAGTARLELNPVTSNPNAWIVDISGQDIGENGETTVVITVSAENGSQYAYYLYVKTDASTQAVTEAPTEVQTEPPTEAETEPETEDPRYVKVERTSLEEAENTIAALKTETSSFRDRVNLLTKILYGMIGLCVVLLFVVINLLLKKKDLKAELQEYMGYGYGGEEYPEAHRKAKRGGQNGNGGYPDGGSYAENGSYPDGGSYAGNGGYDDGGYAGNGGYDDSYAGNDGYDDGSYTGNDGYDDGSYTGDVYNNGGYPDNGGYGSDGYADGGSYPDGGAAEAGGGYDNSGAAADESYDNGAVPEGGHDGGAAAGGRAPAKRTGLLRGKRAAKKEARQAKQEASDPDLHFEDDWDAEYPEEAAGGKKQTKEAPVPARRGKADDPNTVPKPSKAKNRAKQMPQYDTPKPQPKYEPPKEKTPDHVEIDMIDL